MVMSCEHIRKVLEWGLDSEANFIVKLWGCTECDWVSDVN